MAEVLRHFGLRPAGGNHGCSGGGLTSGESRLTTSPARLHRCAASRIALEDVLVPGSTYQRGQLKQRLYDAGIKERECELCGQGEEW